jgi:hypothetical protein
VSNKRSEDFSRRKQALMVKASHERAEIAAAYENVSTSLDLNQALLGIGRTLKNHPMITAGISTFLVSGLAGKLLRSTGQVVALSRLALPLWSWWKNRR